MLCLWHDFASGSDIKPCFKIDTYFVTLHNAATTTAHIYGKILTYLCLKRDFKVTPVSHDK